MHHKPNPVRLSSHPDPSGHAQIVPFGFPHHVEDEPFPHIVRDAHCLCGINLSDLISQICRNSGWQKWASLLIELQQCASHLRVDSLDFSQPHSAMHRCCGTNYCTRYYVLYSYLSTNHMLLVHQTSSSMLQVSCSNFVKYVGNALFCPFLPFWHFLHLFNVLPPPPHGHNLPDSRCSSNHLWKRSDKTGIAFIGQEGTDSANVSKEKLQNLARHHTA